MTNEPYFICSDCGRNVLAVSDTWTNKVSLEEVGTVQDDGRLTIDAPTRLCEADGDHEWVAYGGGCGHGVTVEWLSEGRLRVLFGSEDDENG